MHISARSIPAGPVSGYSCTIPASPTTTCLCALFNDARQLMQISLGMKTPRRCSARPTGQPPDPPHPTAAAAPLPLPPPLQ